MKWYLWFLIIFFGLIILRLLIRGYFFKTKSGEKLKFKVFMKRWGKGIEGITGLQQKKMQLMGIWITITGIVSGIVVNCLIRIKNMWWWILIILIGSLILILVQFLGTYQAYKKFKIIDEKMKELNNNNQKEENI
jgi:phosphotransferase system  glucose/maltose/N-acetylglucosamine-specific IIC component